MKGKVAIVTGAGTGIGQALAVGLANAGANVALVYRSHIDETMELMKDKNVKVQSYQCDFESAPIEEIKKIVYDVVEDFGGLDILVNNAGTICLAPALEYPVEYWDTVLKVNLVSVFYLCQAAAEHFIAKKIKGKIINIASLSSYIGGDLIVAYTASKSGIAGITKTMANEWAQYNINVNAIAPGYIVSENTRPLWENPKRNDQILGRVPAGRWGQPEDLIGTTLFLASSASDYVHGVTIPVDGGFLTR